MGLQMLQNGWVTVRLSLAKLYSFNNELKVAFQSSGAPAVSETKFLVKGSQASSVLTFWYEQYVDEYEYGPLLDYI
jgi:hypothetical protein